MGDVRELDFGVAAGDGVFKGLREIFDQGDVAAGEKGADGGVVAEGAGDVAGYCEDSAHYAVVRARGAESGRVFRDAQGGHVGVAVGGHDG